MDLSTRYVYFFVFLGVFLLEKVLPCELLSGRRLPCGTNVSNKKQCPKTCCFDTRTTPNCYFTENAYGPIKHSKGLCINVKDGSHADSTPLIWSRDCTSRNAFFLVSYDHPPYHVASGKCVLPPGNENDPQKSTLVLKRDDDKCNRDIVTYRPTKNGNLEYYYLRGSYKICIGNKTGSSNPKENDYVHIPGKACQVDNTCQHALSYVYQRKFYHTKSETIQCYVGRTIKIIWVNYDSTKTSCVSTEATTYMQNKCDGRSTCNFNIRKTVEFSVLTSCPNTFLVRYTCKVDAMAKPAAPSNLNVLVKSRDKLFVTWSNDASSKNNTMIRIEICRFHSTRPVPCSTVFSWESSLRKTLSSLQPATQYNVTVARYSCDKSILGIERLKIAITRSAALKSGKISATSFKIRLGSLKEDDRYVQIVVSKLRNNEKPANHPGNDLQPYDVNTVDSKPYITAELNRNYVNQNNFFTVGDGIIYGFGTKTRRWIDFQNAQLEPETFYSVFQRTFKSSDLYYDSNWMKVIKTDKLPPTTTSSTPLTTASAGTTERNTITQPGGEDDEKRDGGGSSDSSDGDSSNGGASTAIIGAAAGGGVLLIVLVLMIIIFIRRRRRENSSTENHVYEKPVKYKSPKKKETVTEVQIHQNDPPAPSDEREENPNVITAPSGDVYAKPIKKKPTPAHSEYQNGIQNDTYNNMQDVSPVEENKGVKISGFHLYVEEMKKNKNFGFQKEFNELPVGQTHPWDVGRRAENVKKNKYANNTAYDHSRVILSGEDYVNANFIEGIRSEVYIAAQGPIDETVNDFWRMIWEQDCTCIIALTKIVELGKVKCCKYWADDERSFGEIRVKTVKTELFADYIIRYLDIKKGGKGNKITQYHFTSWPDHGVPKYPTKLLAFRHRFRALHTVSSQPIVVHCSAGVGRTGTFIALDMTLLRLNQLKEDTININETIDELRSRRVNMVQTLEQYILVHDAVLETVLCGFTEIVAENLKTEIERLEQKELNKSLTGFEIEFNKLSTVCHPLSAEECTAALLQKNKSKNRDSKIYPTENLRVYLCGSKEEEDPYINATYVHSHSQARAYIATQAPLPHTINDFWQMVFEKKSIVVVMLNNISEGKTVYPQYWPDDFNEEKKYGDLFVKMLSAETRGLIVSRKFVITNKNKNAAVTEHVVRHVQFTDWPEHGVPGNYNDVMDLLVSVEEAQQRSANGAVIVHCSNGAHRTGTYLTLAIQRERVSSEHVIDIFRCVKMLREQRPQFVGNLDQYKFCYYAMLTFMETFKTYDNIPKLLKE